MTSKQWELHCFNSYVDNFIDDLIHEQLLDEDDRGLLLASVIGAKLDTEGFLGVELTKYSRKTYLKFPPSLLGYLRDRINSLKNINAHLTNSGLIIWYVTLTSMVDSKYPWRISKDEIWGELANGIRYLPNGWKKFSPFDMEPMKQDLGDFAIYNAAFLNIRMSV